MNGYQKAIKWISIITIIFAILTILLGIASCSIGGLALGAAASEASGHVDEATAVGGAVVLFAGAAIIVGGVVDIIIGLLGLRGAKDPNKITPFYVFVIIGLVFSIINLVLTFTSGAGIEMSSVISGLVNLALMIILLVCANKVRQMRTY